MSRRQETAKGPKFTCGVCDGLFHSEKTQEQMDREFLARFPSEAAAPCSIVCEKCSQLIEAWLASKN